MAVFHYLAGKYTRAAGGGTVMAAGWQRGEFQFVASIG
jgi:hypothetical protein